MNTPDMAGVAQQAALTAALTEAHRRGQQHMIPQIGALLFEIARLNAQIEHDCGDGNPDIQLPFVYEFDPRNMAALSKFSISIEPDEANNKVRFILSEAAHQQPVPGEALILSPETRAAIAADVMKK